ncbi:MAG: acyl carrier protein [Spirochaetales bacterium]|nr:acyl carrier protein [Spirochaetales bacterium]
MTRDEIFGKMKVILVETFEIEPDEIQPEALLLEDLDLDSIDAVDLIVQLQQFTNKKIDPEAFKKVKTIQDIVDAIYDLMGSGAIS